MTNYSKWDKFAADIASDTESEEEREMGDYTEKRARYIHLPPKDFSTKAQCCAILEEDDDFEAPSSAAAGVLDEGAAPEAGVGRALKQYGWSSIGSQFVPGYGSTSGGDDLWRVFFDDNFLSTQRQPNRGARALIGHKSLGSFVIACMNRSTGEDRPISRKEVADLILRRQQGGDAERINLEHEQQKANMKLFEDIGAETVNLGGEES